jgi:hypothetical protein
MRNILTIAALATTLVALGVATAGADPGKDSVKGNGMNNPPNGRINKFHLNVQSGPNGEDVKGKVTFTGELTKASFAADAVCLKVTGSTATVVADVSKFRKEADSFAANFVKVTVVDTTTKKVGGTSDDQIYNSISLSDTAPSCADPVVPNATSTLSKGDIRVEDN